MTELEAIDKELKIWRQRVRGGQVDYTLYQYADKRVVAGRKIPDHDCLAVTRITRRAVARLEETQNHARRAVALLEAKRAIAVALLEAKHALDTRIGE